MPPKAGVLQSRGDHLRTIEPPREFQFIEVDDTSPEQKKKNRSIAHSHVKKVERRARRARYLYVENDLLEKPSESQSTYPSTFFESWTSTTSSTSLISSTSSGYLAIAKKQREISQQAERRYSTSSSMLTLGEDWVELKPPPIGLPSIQGCLRPTIDLSYAPGLGGCFGTQSPVTQLVLDHGQFRISGSTWKER